jgi:NAD+ kinase
MNARDKQIATDLAYKIIRDVSRAIRPYVGKPESGEKIKMGADGTPTSLIDVIAEERIINILKNAPVLSYIISEEVGELKLGKGTQKNIVLTQELRRTDLDEEDTPKFIFLIDPVDGTNNAIKEIPAFGISIAIANVEQGRLSTLHDV